jgi:hypothetical protein
MPIAKQIMKNYSLGPEQETLLERFVNFFRLPYPLTGLLLGMICGTLIYILVRYVDTGMITLPTSPFGVISSGLYTALPPTLSSSSDTCE